jgi:hypothetical protein
VREILGEGRGECGHHGNRCTLQASGVGPRRETVERFERVREKGEGVRASWQSLHLASVGSGATPGDGGDGGDV